MENDEVAPAVKKQVSEKVMQNLLKAQAKRKELHEQKRAERSAEKDTLKKQKKIDKLKKQLVSLIPQQESEEEEEISSEPIQEMARLRAEQRSFPQETPVVVKKVKAPPPVVEAKKATQYATPKPVKEKAKPTPKPAVEYY